MVQATIDWAYSMSKEPTNDDLLNRATWESSVQIEEIEDDGRTEEEKWVQRQKWLDQDYHPDSDIVRHAVIMEEDVEGYIAGHRYGNEEPIKSCKFCKERYNQWKMFRRTAAYFNFYIYIYMPTVLDEGSYCKKGRTRAHDHHGRHDRNET